MLFSRFTIFRRPRDVHVYGRPISTTISTQVLSSVRQEARFWGQYVFLLATVRHHHGFQITRRVRRTVMASPIATTGVLIHVVIGRAPTGATYGVQLLYRHVWCVYVASYVLHPIFLVIGQLNQGRVPIVLASRVQFFRVQYGFSFQVAPQVSTVIGGVIMHVGVLRGVTFL